ncbi:terpenoid synthase [Pluteus cervinus]|uniref:Terpenoid synthase n=1 Tax=Pluteus cervinus TaxID=181527 RepID=A0ACD3B4H6_9AGAR|nr:terpenoid synthase [Pluteus cervinus]
MNSSTKYFKLPDLLASCPFPVAISPYYAEAAAESRAWVNSYNILTDRKRAFLLQGFSELLCSYVYPYAGYQQLRTCCDFVNLLFVVDEVSDEQSGEDAEATGNIFLNALKDPKWDDGSSLAKMTRDFRERLLQLASPNWFPRFVRCCEDYTNSVAKEAVLRETNHVLNLSAYTVLRRENSAVRLCYALIEYIHDIDLPDEVYADPDFTEVYFAAVDHICWANDVYSYNMEQAMGHTGNNVMTVLMKEHALSLQEASDAVGDHCAKLVDVFLSGRQRLPSWGPAVDSDVRRYIEGLSRWMRGNIEWSFESQRYFGTQHAEIKETLFISLRPSEVPLDSDSDSDSD